MEIKNKLTSLEWRGRAIMGERKGRVDQRTYIKDPWTYNGVGINCGSRGGLGGGGQRGKNWDNSNRIT